MVRAIGPYRRGREGEREQHALTRRAALPLRSADERTQAGRTRCVDQPPPAGFTAEPRWRTARIPAARSGWRLSCAIAKGVGNQDRLASRSAHRLHRTRVVAAGRGHEPRPVPGPLTERSDLMTQKICFDCFHKLFPDKPIRKVTLGRQCVVCKAQTDRTEQMIPVEAEDIPLVKQIAS